MRRAFIGTLALICGLTLAPVARACGPEVVIRFIDSSPDLFIIENKSLEPWTLLSLEFHAAQSAGRVVFDTDFGGAGASEPHQFETVEGEVGLMKAPVVADGAEELILHFTNFQAGRKFVFTIDLDDRLENSPMGQAYVTGEEIAGAEVTGLFTHPQIGEGKARGTFGTDGTAHLRGATCA
ncbi:MAG: hypothetical protein RIE87_08235 [Rhodospirillales bacterium]